ncbi:unnamed protein product [Protopolystoma xenopodis]|uniref:Uncharacterized protein n=1 Tax=Protopolystoma xenopodis TaxID=117903 RepID=A0A448XHU7_9PLAT|nr:unnamed protein product [Protopolystoma xenopodis]
MSIGIAGTVTTLNNVDEHFSENTTIFQITSGVEGGMTPAVNLEAVPTGVKRDSEMGRARLDCQAAAGGDVCSLGVWANVECGGDLDGQEAACGAKWHDSRRGR